MSQKLVMFQKCFGIITKMVRFLRHLQCILTGFIHDSEFFLQCDSLLGCQNTHTHTHVQTVAGCHSNNRSGFCVKFFPANRQHRNFQPIQTLALKPMGRVNRSPKQVAPVAPQNGDLSPQENYKKKTKKHSTKPSKLRVTMGSLLVSSASF